MAADDKKVDEQQAADRAKEAAKKNAVKPLPNHYVTIVAGIASGVAASKGAGYFTDGSAKDIAEAALKVLNAATLMYQSQQQ